MLPTPARPPSRYAGHHLTATKKSRASAPLFLSPDLRRDAAATARASPAGDFSFNKGELDHRITDQSSILCFIEDNWGLGRLGGGSADEKAGTLNGFFDFDDSRNIWLLLDVQTGQLLSTH